MTEQQGTARLDQRQGSTAAVAKKPKEATGAQPSPNLAPTPSSTPTITAPHAAHHAGRPPHGPLDAEPQGSVADDLIPPVEPQEP